MAKPSTLQKLLGVCGGVGIFGTVLTIMVGIGMIVLWVNFGTGKSDTPPAQLRATAIVVTVIWCILFCVSCVSVNTICCYFGGRAILEGKCEITEKCEFLEPILGCVLGCCIGCCCLFCKICRKKPRPSPPQQAAVPAQQPVAVVPPQDELQEMLQVEGKDTQPGAQDDKSGEKKAEEKVEEEKPKLSEEEETKEIHGLIVELLKCPIEKKIFEDPVLVTSGETFERIAIEKWLQTSDKCPKSNVTLRSKDLVSNNPIKQLAEKLKQTESDGDIKKVLKEHISMFLYEGPRGTMKIKSSPITNGEMTIEQGKEKDEKFVQNKLLQLITSIWWEIVVSEDEEGVYSNKSYECKLIVTPACLMVHSRKTKEVEGIKFSQIKKLEYPDSIDASVPVIFFIVYSLDGVEDEDKIKFSLEPKKFEEFKTKIEESKL